MSSYVTLLGAEDVSRAGGRMADAAQDMQRAASTIEGAADRLCRAMDDAAQRMQDAAERFERSPAATPVRPDVSGGDPWHLFYVEAQGAEEGDVRCWHWLVSAQSASQIKAEELARAAVDDVIPESMYVSHAHFVCISDRDVFDECGRPGARA